MAKTPESPQEVLNPRLNPIALTQVLLHLISTQDRSLELVQGEIKGYEVGNLNKSRIVRSKIVGPHVVPKFRIKGYKVFNFAVIEDPSKPHLPPIQRVYGLYAVLEGGFKYFIPLIKLQNRK